MVHAVQKPAKVALLVASASVACGERVYVGSDIIWSAEHEAGDLSEWADGAAGADNLGEGEGTVGLTQEHVHSGSFAVKLSKDVDASSLTHGGGPRLVRLGLPAEAFYSAWYFVPVAYQTHSYWTIMQFDSLKMTNVIYDRGVDLQLRGLPDGGLVLQVLFHNEAYLLAPLSDPPPQVPIGRWFQIEAEFRAASDTTGKMVVWLDGRRVYELRGRPTVTPEALEFMVSSLLLDLEPSPVDLYVDDVVVSKSRTTPAGRLHASD
jgi:hypothetical protein